MYAGSDLSWPDATIEAGGLTSWRAGSNTLRTQINSVSPAQAAKSWLELCTPACRRSAGAVAMTLVYAGPTLRKMIVYFKDLSTTGPALVETGTNTSWPDGAEFKILKRSIQRDYSHYTEKPLYIYAVHADENPPDVKDLCWDEFAINGVPMLTIGATDLLPPPTPEHDEQQDLAAGVNLHYTTCWFSRSRSRRRGGGNRRRCPTPRTWARSRRRGPSCSRSAPSRTWRCRAAAGRA